MRTLEGKRCLVTGGSRGLGLALGLAFARAGARVAFTWNRNAADAADATALLTEAAGGVAPLGFRGSVTDAAHAQQTIKDVVAAWGGLDVLVNNAGIQKPCPSHEIEAKDFDQILSVNVRGPFLCAREAIRHFLERGSGGVIINNSSVHEIIPKPKYLSYSISKGGMENLTRTLALEYADRGIRVNAVGPGAVVTPINSAWTGNPKARADVESHIPMNRAACPEEIASVFTFLASDEARYITGQTIFACGGLTLYPEFRVAWSSGE